MSTGMNSFMKATTTFRKHVGANRINSEWKLTKIPRHTATLYQEMGIELEAPAKFQVSLK